MTTFTSPELVVPNFGYQAGGWRVENHPRFLADITGDGRADVVGFGNAGVYVSRAQASLLADTIGDGQAQAGPIPVQT